MDTRKHCAVTMDTKRRDFRDITGAIYEMLSGPAGSRNYASVRHFYHPDARLIRTGVDENGDAFTTVMSIDDHASDVNKLLCNTAFVEEEIDHQVEIFGNVARVKSVYRSVYGAGETARASRGVNLFNFFFDGCDWKIISCVWDNEREGFRLNL